MARKRNQPGEFVFRVNVFLDDVKREIIEPAETPHGQRQQHGGPPFRIVEKNENGGGDADEQEKHSLQFDPKWVGQVFHNFRCGGVSAERRVSKQKCGCLPTSRYAFIAANSKSPPPRVLARRVRRARK